MIEALTKPSTAFEGSRLLSSGPLVEVALAIKNAIDRGSMESILAFDDATGRVVDLDLRGSKADVIARLARSVAARGAEGKARRAPPSATAEPEPRGRGRPKLGVVGREVTLLPRHWKWLATQPGSASVTLRRLVDEARRTGGAKQQTRAAQEAAYKFMVAMAGDLPGFEEAARALFADDPTGFDRQVEGWPSDVRDHARSLAFGSRPTDRGAARQDGALA